MARAKFGSRFKEITPFVATSALGVIKPVFGNILLAEVQDAACAIVGFGLNSLIYADCMKGPCPTEVGSGGGAIDYLHWRFGQKGEGNCEKKNQE
jgi:hypothetical protein